MIAWIDEIDAEQLKGKAVLCRVDLNVPMNERGEILDASRIELSLPTIRRLIRAGAKVVLISHLGRPKGKPRASLSLEPVAEYLRDLLNQEIIFVHDAPSDGIERIVATAAPGDVILLENLRFNPGEEKNDLVFSKLLRKGMDFYVNDAFASVHRAHASVEGVARLFKEPLGGMLLKKELQHFEKLMSNPDRPFVAVVGGAKVSSKIHTLIQLLKKVDSLLIGGAMAYTFLRAQGQNVGASLVEEDFIDAASNIQRKAKELGVAIHLPVDHVVASALDKSSTRVVSSGGFAEDDCGFDIGPKTIRDFECVIEKAKTIFLNGPMGLFEESQFAHGTDAILQAIAKSSALSVAGGGDTMSALNKSGLSKEIGFVSSGGGASLELLEGKKLPGLLALNYYS
jgi:phosphoglycerate kinase